MAQNPVVQRRPGSERMLEELKAMRHALEGIGQVLRSWAGSQGQPRCHVDDRIPEAIERLANPQAVCRTSASGAESSSDEQV